MPLPVRLTDCGELFALLLTVSVPPLVPRPVGENRIVSEHLSLGPIVAPQPLTIGKSALVTMLENVTVVVLLSFLIVTCLGLLTAPSPNTTLPRLSRRGETFSEAGTTVAVGVAVGVAVAVAVAVTVAVGVMVAVAVAVCVAVAVAVAV